jgi:hypothetical protein
MLIWTERKWTGVLQRIAESVGTRRMDSIRNYPCVFVKENTQGEKEYVPTFVDVA